MGRGLAKKEICKSKKKGKKKEKKKKARIENKINK